MRSAAAAKQWQSRSPVHALKTQLAWGPASVVVKTASTGDPSQPVLHIRQISQVAAAEYGTNHVAVYGGWFAELALPALCISLAHYGSMLTGREQSPVAGHPPTSKLCATSPVLNPSMLTAGGVAGERKEQGHLGRSTAGLHGGSAGLGGRGPEDHHCNC